MQGGAPHDGELPVVVGSLRAQVAEEALGADELPEPFAECAHYTSGPDELRTQRAKGRLGVLEAGGKSREHLRLRSLLQIAYRALEAVQDEREALRGRAKLRELFRVELGVESSNGFGDAVCREREDAESLRTCDDRRW